MTHPTDTQVLEDLEKSVPTTKFNDSPCVWIPLKDAAEYIVSLRKADRAYLAGETQRLIDEENNRPFGVAPVSLKKMLAIINQ